MIVNIPGYGLLDVDKQLEELDLADEREACEESLYEFLVRAWKYIDPAPWKDGWPIEAVAEHLQAVVDGEIRKLLINIPPRCAKSSVCSVALPAWTWAQPRNSPTSGPAVPFLYASYAKQLSVRDSRKCRQLIESPWYQKLWGKRFNLVSDSNTVGRFTNNFGGERLITSVGSAATGEGGNIIVVDDPNAADEALSEASTVGTIDWWDGTMSTRRNDPKTGAFIVVQQRLGEDDLTGHILSKDDGDWTHLVLPMHYDPDRSFVTSIGWKDPRTEEGQLLWEERFGEDEVRELERSLGPWKAAGQLEQSPQPKGGGIVKREWWQPWDEPQFPPMDFILASLDTAYTTKTMNDASALTVWGVFTDDTVAVQGRRIDDDGRPVYMDRVYAQTAPKVMLMTAWNERLELHQLVEKVADTCKRFKVDVLAIENKAAGHSVAQELRRLYSHEKFGVRMFDPKSQDKTSRLYSVQHLFSDGIIYAPDRKYADEVITQTSIFPNGKHDDLVDTVSMGIRLLRDMGLLVRGPEKTAEIEESRQYHGRPPEALYPG